MWEFIITYWVDFALGIMASALVAGFKVIHSKLKKWQKEQNDVKEGVLSLLHDRLFEESKRLLEQEKATQGELRNLECLYNGYHALGGNGTGTEMYERVRKLPLNTNASE